MSLLVTDITFKQAIRSIRELILDINPVRCFRVYGQDFAFMKDSSGIVLDGVSYTFDEVARQYDLVRKLRTKGVSIQIYPDYVASEPTESLIDINFTLASDESKIFERDNYFSDYIISNVVVDYFASYMGHSNQPRSIEYIFNTLHYMEKRKLILWVAYYMVDKKRMFYASTAEMIRLQSEQDGGLGCSSDGQLKNSEVSITTRIGEVFSVTEKDADTGKGFEGFTDFWGDKFGYFTKLQLYIRSMFEKQFQDYSLRDDCMITQTFTMEKQWQLSAWIDTHDLSSFTRDVLLPNMDE